MLRTTAEAIVDLPDSPDTYAGLNRIQFACSRFLRDDWLNTDLAGFRSEDGAAQTRVGGLYRVGEALFHRLDATEPLPYPDGSFACAYAEHFIEHIPQSAAIDWLREVRRILEPGGFVRVTTPDLARYVAGYADPSNGFFADHHAALSSHRKYRDAPRRPAWMINQLFYHWDHRWIYDVDELRHVAEAAGFGAGALRVCAFASGRREDVAALDLAARADETLYVEIDRG